jgi:hypothetical protein
MQLHGSVESRRRSPIISIGRPLGKKNYLIGTRAAHAAAQANFRLPVTKYQKKRTPSTPFVWDGRHKVCSLDFLSIRGLGRLAWDTYFPNIRTYSHAV